MSVRAGVRNIGGRPGSAVVQLYVSKPDDGALSQPARELVAFVRTAALEPGAAQTVELDVPWRDLASYDDSGATGHRFAWVLPAGTYTFHLGADVHSILSATIIILYTLYATDGEVISRNGPYLYVSVFPVATGLFHYLRHVIVKGCHCNPTDMLYQDHGLQLSSAEIGRVSCRERV